MSATYTGNALSRKERIQQRRINVCLLACMVDQIVVAEEQCLPFSISRGGTSELSVLIVSSIVDLKPLKSPQQTDYSDLADCVRPCEKTSTRPWSTYT